MLWYFFLNKETEHFLPRWSMASELKTYVAGVLLEQNTVFIAAVQEPLESHQLKTVTCRAMNFLHRSRFLKGCLLFFQTSRDSRNLVAAVDGVRSTPQTLPTDLSVILCDQQAARGERRQREEAREDEQSQYGLHTAAGFSHSSNSLCHAQTSSVVQQRMSNGIKADAGRLRYRGGVKYEDITAGGDSCQTVRFTIIPVRLYRNFTMWSTVAVVIIMAAKEEVRWRDIRSSCRESTVTSFHNVTLLHLGAFVTKVAQVT